MFRTHDVLRLVGSELVDVRIEQFAFDIESLWTRFVVHGWLPYSPLRTLGGERDNARLTLYFDGVEEVRAWVGLTRQERADLGEMSDNLLEAAAVAVQRSSEWAGTYPEAVARELRHFSILWDAAPFREVRSRQIDVLGRSITARYSTIDGLVQVWPAATSGNNDAD